MVHPNRNRGNKFERELVNLARAACIPARRAHGSDGKALGKHSEVDCEVGGFDIQAKRKKTIAKDLIPSEHVDCVAMRPDRGEALIVMRYVDWLKLVEAHRRLQIGDDV